MADKTTSRRRRLAFASFAALTLSLLASSGAAAWSSVSSTRSPFVRDVYFAAGYERQVDNRTCTAAATAMMLNFIADRDLSLNQYAILGYEKPRDALSDSVQRGSDPLGWATALTHYASVVGEPTTYRWWAFGARLGALRVAARQIALYGKPVGLLVDGGAHAVVMTGFQSDRDPRSGDWTLQRIWVSDPYAGHHVAYSPSSPPLTRYLQLDATPTYDHLWYNRFIIVAPIS